MNNKEAIDVLNDVIRTLYGFTQESNQSELNKAADKLDEVRQFLGEKE